MEIEFTDRYGGQPPSWLTACHECEAMGCHPSGTGDNDPFVTCEACQGTARVPMWRALARVPRWVVKGLRFVWDVRKFNYPPPEGVSMLANMWMAFKCAFLVDLGLWRP